MVLKPILKTITRQKTYILVTLPFPLLLVRSLLSLLIFSEVLFNFIHRGGSRTAATSEMERFVVIANGWKPLTIITKRTILDVAAVIDPPLIQFIFCKSFYKRIQTKYCMLLHVTYAFQSESTLDSCLNTKELLSRNRHEIRSLSDCNWTRIHNHLVRKRTLNHLAKLA